jgi:DNA adenine methylase
MELLTTTEMANKWNITRRRVAEYCKEGRIDGAVLKGKTWLIPEDANKPKDPRKQKQINIEEYK